MRRKTNIKIIRMKDKDKRGIEKMRPEKQIK